VTDELVEELPFLGNRTYLQGTTLFECLHRYATPDAPFSFKVPRIIRTPRIKSTVIVGRQIAPTVWDAVLRWKSEAREGCVYATGLPHAGEPRRIPFDENQVVALARFAADAVELKRESPFEFVTTIVSLNKACLLRSGKDFGRGRWAFTRLDLSRLPSSARGVRLEIDASVSASHATRTRVLLDGTRLGELYFAWVST
jgi:hypothetical protein